MSLIYADYNSTYPCAAAHIDDVAGLLKQADGNPSNIHAVGRRAKLAVEDARARIVALLGAQRDELFFTSGATEANNWVLQALLAPLGGRAPAAGTALSELPHVVITAGEHASILEPLTQLVRAGYCELSVVGLDAQGYVSSDELMAALRPTTRLVALIYASNEVGTVNDLPSLVARIKTSHPQVHVHSDGVQAFGKLDLTWVGRSGLDSLALSAHKVGGFKGVGCLWLNRAARLASFIVGGGQERQRRAGTENVPGILSFGIRAAEIAQKPQWLAEAYACGRSMRAGLLTIPGAVVHGDGDKGLAHTVNFHLEGVSGEVLLLQLDMAGICASSGSACASGVGSASRVLLGMGYPEWVARNSVRLSFGAGSSAEDVGSILAVIRQCRR